MSLQVVLDWEPPQLLREWTKESTSTKTPAAATAVSLATQRGTLITTAILVTTGDYSGGRYGVGVGRSNRNQYALVVGGGWEKGRGEVSRIVSAVFDGVEDSLDTVYFPENNVGKMAVTFGKITRVCTSIGLLGEWGRKWGGLESFLSEGRYIVKKRYNILFTC